MKSAAKLSFLTIPAIVGIGFLMGLVSNSGFGNPWFDQLTKPAAMPPGWVFGVAWTVLYVLLGIALALALAAPPSSTRRTALSLFILQLILNYSWSPLFFAAHQVRIALAAIVIILALSVAAAIALRRVNEAATLLMAPYLAWLCFATYLNFEIMRLNPGA
jgi:tryptophan-rich sensory protein